MIRVVLLNPWIVSALIIFLTFLIKRLFSASPNPSKPQKNPPPSPPTFPILGNLHQLGLHPHRSLARLARRHGPLMLLRFGSRPVLIASSAEAVREIMKTQDTVFSSRPKSNLGDKLLYQQRDITSAPYGEYWRQIRSICVIHLLSAKRVQSFRPVREAETAVLVENIRQRSRSPVNLSDMFASLSGDIICRVAFGKKHGGGGGGDGSSEGVFFKDMMLELMRLLGSFGVGDFVPWLSWVNRVNGVDARADRVAKAFDEFLDGVVDQHELSCNGEGKGEDDEKDLVDVLLEIQRGTKKDGFRIDRNNIKPIILDMFVGGTDTTYTVLEWAMTELLRHPNILKKLQEELTETANGKQGISESDLDKMPYLKALIKETLRFHPPLPLTVPREASQDTKVNGFDVAAGTMVIANAWAIGRDPASWDDPEEFRPERFLNSGIDFKLGNDHFQLIPFGGGRRSCPGVLFSMVIIELVLANLVHRFDWALPEGTRREDLDMTECVGSISHRKTPLLAVATPRF